MVIKNPVTENKLTTGERWALYALLYNFSLPELAAKLATPQGLEEALPRRSRNTFGLLRTYEGNVYCTRIFEDIYFGVAVAGDREPLILERRGDFVHLIDCPLNREPLFGRLLTFYRMLRRVCENSGEEMLAKFDAVTRDFLRNNRGYYEILEQRRILF